MSRDKCDYCKKHFGPPSRDHIREITGAHIPVCKPKVLDKDKYYYDLPSNGMEELIIKAYNKGKDEGKP